MIKKIFKTFVIFLGIMAIAMMATAQTPLYYELSGVVDDADDGTDAAGRTIRFYRADREDYTEGLATAQIQPDGSFSLNIFEIWPDAVVIGGEYRMDVPIENGYGVPVTQNGISISGKGYDVLADGLLALMTADEVLAAGPPPGAGGGAPGAPPAAGKANIQITLNDARWDNVVVAGADVEIADIGNAVDQGLGKYFFANVDPDTYTINASKKYYIAASQKVSVAANETKQVAMSIKDSVPPVIGSIRFGNRVYHPQLVAKGRKFVISPNPQISALLTNEADSGISADTVIMVVDPGLPNAKKFEAKEFSASGTKTESVAGVERVKETSVSMTVPQSAMLTEGKHNIRFTVANDYERVASYSVSVEVMGGPLRIVDVPLTFPSPFSRPRHGTVTVQYTLSADADIDVYITDVGGQRVKKFMCESGSEGGSAGMNKLTWDGMTAMGVPAGNAIYMGTIIARREGRLLAKFKLTIVH